MSDQDNKAIQDGDQGQQDQAPQSAPDSPESGQDPAKQSSAAEGADAAAVASGKAPDTQPPKTGTTSGCLAAPSGCLGGVVILILLGALGYGGWLGLGMWQDVEQLRARLDQAETALIAADTLQASLEAVRGDLASLESRLGQTTENTGQAGAAVSALGNELATLRERVETLAAVDMRPLQLAEAASLLRLARQRLVLARDVQSALGLLDAADAILRRMNDTSVLPVRQALAADINGLRSLDAVDRDGLYLALGAMVEELQDMRLITAREQRQGEEVVLDDANDEPDLMSRVLAMLDDYVTVRRHDEPLRAEISAEQGFALRQAMTLKLEQARLALLREQPELYRAALEETGRLAGTYLSTANPGKDAFLARLAEMAARPIQVTPPNTLAALDAIERLGAGARQ